MSEALDLSKFESQLKTSWLGRAPGWRNELWESLGSTNTRAAELAAEGAPEGVIVLARHQMAGRGRLGRTWVSPVDAGLYMSLILRPQQPQSQIPLLTIAAGVAVADAIRSVCDLKVGLKWVNDIIYERRKIGGILAEMPALSRATDAAKQLPQAVIVGIGININLKPEDIPEELTNKIDSLAHIKNEDVDPNKIAAAIAGAFEDTSKLLNPSTSQQLTNRWRDLSITIGQMIVTENSERKLEGKAVDITDSGALIVELSDGSRMTLHAGEISIRTPDGSYC
ncbi:MAG TPA: biotin--[acetyl-CoA-carboxylase] ligase [Candidatus Melainabacteria bacterium]|nr:biotin--[acetyl-CoA-carboxylase] ligase [Candidatus Melainabacteria bacterium]HIN67558.1 biotin--[acetyl-CoA-carboxylase] ligase [Candidatus Obscuribacterales bacterium]